MRGLFGLTSEFLSEAQIELGQGDACQGEEPPNQGSPQHTRWSCTHAHHKTAQQSRGGMMDRDRKTEGGASSEPAFDVSQVCLRVRGLFGLTGEFVAVL